MKTLRIAEDLTLPLETVTQTVAVLAKRRAGKSYAMRRLVEQLFKAGQQIVLIDPKGDQYGVRSAADGKGPGLAIVILGGERADVPLEAGSGEMVAKLVVEERVSCLLDLSLFRKHEVATFMTGFLENLYRMKAREIYRTPLMLVIDEADAIAPQKPQKGEERMLGAAEDIVRRGGQRGIGCVLVTQRSAVLNKNVLTQAQVLIALRTIAPQDLDAMQAWIDVHGTAEQRKTLMESLPSLPVGDAWVWSPGWPTVDGIFQRVHVLPIETFDSGATPKPGEKRAEPKTVADVDLDALKRQMAATIAKAKADDPRELRKQIAEKDRLLKQLQANHAKGVRNMPANIPPKTVEKFVLKDGQLARAEKLVAAIDATGDTYAKLEARLSDFENDLRSIAKEIRDAIAATRAPQPDTPTTTAQRQPLLASSLRREPDQKVGPATPRVSSASTGDSAVGNTGGDGNVKLNRRAERQVLQVLAAHGPRSTRQLAIQSGYAASGGGFRGALSKLKTTGLIRLAGSGTLEITDAGQAAIGDVEPLPTGDALVGYWMQQFNRLAEREVLRVVVEAYPDALTSDIVASRTNPPYEPNGGGFRGAVSKLRTLGLIEGRGELRASEELFG